MTHSIVQMIQTVLTVPETSSAETCLSCWQLPFLYLVQVPNRLSFRVPISPVMVSSPAGQWQHIGIMGLVTLGSMSYRFGGEAVETLTTK